MAEKEFTAQRLVDAVRKRGSNADDPRDAAHEACHALEWGVTKKWTRDNIHARKPRIRSDGVSSEITARAVEAIVCADLGVKYDVDKWAFTCWMEMLKNEGISLPTGSWLADAIRRRMKTDGARRMANRVLALGDQ